ncbi:142_t:CDS:2, partial [Gigaspora margarita]
SKVPFKVTLGRNNDVSDFKKIIKNEIPNEFPNHDIDEIRLWKPNVPVSYKNIEELQKITLQDNENVTYFTDYWAKGQIPFKKRIHVIVEPEQLTVEHLTKKRRIEQGWKSYKASDGHSVELPPKIIGMLKNAFQDLYIGKSITLPHLGQVPKHFGGYQERTLLVTKQMIDIWGNISADSDYSIKRVLSGPKGVGKSYISYFLASKAYAEEWLILYIADASELNVDNSDRAWEVICMYFLAQNKDILTATELEMIVRNVKHPSVGVEFLGKHHKVVRVIFTGISHARYEMEYMKNGQSEFWMIYVGIKEEAKKFTNCVPRELMYLTEHIKKLNITITNVNGFRQVLEQFEIERVDKILTITQTYYNGLPQNQKTRYYDTLTSMFLSSKPVVQFDWEFLDLGLIYRYKEGVTHYFPLCQTAQKALLKTYMAFDLPENIKNQLRVGSLTGDQFEEALFNRLVCNCNKTIQLNNATDLNNNNRNVITLHFNDYDLIKNSQLSLGPGNDKVLGRGFNSKSSTNIRQAFEPMLEQAGISLAQIDGKNQIEMYLDEMYGPGHYAKIDLQNRFVVTRNGIRVHGFRIVYIRGSPDIPNHSGKVHDFPDVGHVTFEEIKSQLFPNIV